MRFPCGFDKTLEIAGLDLILSPLTKMQHSYIIFSQMNRRKLGGHFIIQSSFQVCIQRKQWTVYAHWLLPLTSCRQVAQSCCESQESPLLGPWHAEMKKAQFLPSSYVHKRVSLLKPQNDFHSQECLLKVLINRNNEPLLYIFLAPALRATQSFYFKLWI